MSDVTPGDGQGTPATTTTEAPWYQGADAETIGHLTNKGWDKMAPKDAALAASKAFREAEKFIGVPPERVLRMPKDAADQEGWNAVYSRLGVPKDTTGYDFSGVKREDGGELPSGFLDSFKNWAHQSKLTPEAAKSLAQEVVKFSEKSDAAQKAIRDGEIAKAKEALANNWGANFEANKFVAQQAAVKLGLTPEQVQAMEGNIGYDKVMEVLRNVGARLGEDKFVANASPGGTGIMSKEQAVAQLAALKRDTDFAQRYLKGDYEAKRQMDALHRIIAA